MRRYILAFLIACLSVSSALATETRVSSMGGEGWLLVDNSNLFLFPARIFDFPNQAIFELGTYSDDHLSGQSIGVIATNNEKFSWGILGLFANRRHSGIEYLESLRSFVPELVLPGPLFDVLYGRKLRRDGLALHLEWAGGSEEGMGGATLASSSYIFGARGGLQFGLGEESRIDVGLGGRRYGFSVEMGDTFLVRDRGRYSYWGGGRLFRQVGDFVAIVPFLSIGREDLSYQSGGGETSNWTESSSRAGLGINITPYREFVLVLGVLAEEKVSRFDSTAAGVVGYRHTHTQVNLPTLVLGVEWEIRNWLIGRAGGQKSLLRDEQRVVEFDITEVSHSWSAPFSLSLGLGLRLGEFLLDAKLDSDFPFTLGHVVSGEEGKVFGQLSATYSFEIF